MENNRITLSIIVPSFNTSKYVNECLPSFFDERLIGKVKIYLIDDGSTDNTATTIEPYIKKYPDYFEYYHKENGGHGSVINFGVFNLIKSKYFKVVDGDDWVDTEELIKLVTALEQLDDDMIICDYTQVYPDRTVYVCCKRTKERFEPDFLSLLITIHSVTYKTSLFLDNDIKMREKVFYEDNEFRLFPLEFVKSYKYLPFNVYQYRMGTTSQSISLISQIRHKKDSDTIISDLLDRYSILKKNNANVSLVELYEKILARFFVNDYLFLYFALKSKKEIKSNIKNLEARTNRFVAIKNYMLEHEKRYVFLKKMNFGPIFMMKIIFRKKLH